MTEQIPLWTPRPEDIDDSNLTAFQRGLPQKFGSYAELHDWSVSETGPFWEAIWDYAGVIGKKGEETFRSDGDMRKARFFPKASINFAENLLRLKGPAPAIIARAEGRDEVTLSWDDLHQQTAALQGWLEAQGVDATTRVAAIVPNGPEAVVAMLATSALGATYSSCSPDFGEQGILDRFGQIEPRVLIACNAYTYGGKVFDIRDKVQAIRAQVPSIKAVLWIDFVEGLPGEGASWAAVQADFANHNLRFEQTSFAHPLYIMFSSGTTGKPKCIVHSAGGTLLQHLKEHKLHANIKPGDRVFYFTTCGWMMWNWLVSALASEATLLLYDGNPFYPTRRVLFDFAAEVGATFYGVSAKYIDALKKKNIQPKESHDLSTIRTIASTGSPLAPESFDYVYESIKKDVNLASISGGTDIVSCFVLGNATLPVWRGEIQCAGLGMAIEIWDDEGKPIIDERGELVCKVAFPSMPIGFWNDQNDEKYRAAYFERFDGVWCHGDFGIETSHGGFVIVGRSDATLNPGGVRIGTAEIYRQVEQIDEVTECIAVGQEWQDDVRVVLFVTLAEGANLTDDLAKEIKTRIRTGASPRHVPAKVIAVQDIPRTKSGKITELAVRDVIHGREIKNTEALANPEALEYFKDLEELKDV
ncbi:MAG: acetoacetate--CoA ligase [Alphaproteobacteria bacterium]|nr:MAG: acetoacetate--CoA ligase [Alphaproteobacteria bacterium]